MTSTVKIISLTLVVLCSFTSSAQHTLETPETCWRARALGNDAMSFGDYKSAVAYFIMGEKMCGDYNETMYDRLVACLMTVISTDENDSIKTAYTDTIIEVWDRMDHKGINSAPNDLNRGYYYLHTTEPNQQKADFYFTRGLNNKEIKINEKLYPVYYSNLCSLLDLNQDSLTNPDLTLRVINECIELSSTPELSMNIRDSIKELFLTVQLNCELFAQNINQMDMKKADIQSKVDTIIEIIQLSKCSEDPELDRIKNKLEAIKTD